MASRFMKTLGSKLEAFELLKAAAIVVNEKEEHFIRRLKEKGVFQDIIIIGSEYEYRVARDGGAMKLLIREEVYPKIKDDLVCHYHVIL